MLIFLTKVAPCVASVTREIGDLQELLSLVLVCAAHSIKDRRCSTAKAVFALDSKFKWALSGTPLQVTPHPHSIPYHHPNITKLEQGMDPLQTRRC